MIRFFSVIKEMIINQEGQKQDTKNSGDIKANLVNQCTHKTLISDIE